MNEATLANKNKTFSLYLYYVGKVVKATALIYWSISKCG